MAEHSAAQSSLSFAAARATAACRHRNGQKRHHCPEDRRHAQLHRSPAMFLHPAEAVHGDLGVLLPAM